MKEMNPKKQYVTEAEKNVETISVPENILPAILLRNNPVEFLPFPKARRG